MSVNTTIVRQLKEIFPSMEEDFLSGLCEGYTLENIDMSELVDLVMGFQNPGIHDQITQNSFQNSVQHVDHQVYNDNGFQYLSDENVISDVIQNNIHNLSPEVDNNDIPYPEEIVFNNEEEMISVLPVIEDDTIVIEDDILVGCAPSRDGEGGNLINTVEASAKSETNKVISGDNQLEGSVKVMSEVCSELESLENKKGTFESESSKLQDQVGNDEDLSIEASIRYLWVEEINVTTKDSQISQNSMKEAFHDEATVKANKLNKQSSNSRNNCALESPKTMSEESIESSHNVSGKSETSHQQRKIRIVSRRSLDSVSYDKSPNHWSPKRVSLRSCKVKNDEWRLRKLLRKNRLSVPHKGQESVETSPISPSQFDNVESKFSLLSKVLPNAQPEYLMEECRKISSQEELLTFISQSLETKDTKIMDPFECTVEEFLMVIPDPVEEFSDSYIRTGYEENAEIYLKSRYTNLELCMNIKELLMTNNYNLTYVCQHLDSLGMKPNPLRVQLYKSASLFFHQEVWYIEHKEEVLNMLESALEAARIDAELNRPPTPPPVEEVFECEICRDEVVDYSELGTCDGPLGHLFCKACVKRSAEIKFAEGGIKFPCLINCGGSIPLQTVKEVMEPQMYEKLMDNIQDVEIKAANMSGMEYCPFCNYAIIRPEEIIFYCKRPSCMKLSCRICRKEAHPEMCAFLKEQDEEAARHLLEEKMTEALVRQCYKCNSQFVKEVGCNKMTCNCGALMCYICRQPVKDYTHFNGPGGDNHNRCELFSDDAAVHDRPVAAAAQQAFQQLAANNPGLNLDMDKIIPK
ncbi:uncharacterized protein LOC124365871 isoform X1 [Homalodisca vitripennis]|uniref:uncharacterized protein LOC124365871 isoform X1 n=1 Tax=Homalodisca vitripennis TaxID=197043 RepID=UPI001EEA59B4|nr:uncharacterized protein LOC124365871 isoform X1 [Homalodisca vitripennis]XP_046677921.1 uncharacterized protein LOC124365871 isoform X1 [Homalodisca vitripennis]